MTIRLSDLRACDCGHWTGCNAKVSESDLLSVLTDEALIGELVKRGVAYTFRCAACELDGCHEGENGGHDGPDNPAIHTRDVWLLAPLSESELEAMEEAGRQAVGEPVGSVEGTP